MYYPNKKFILPALVLSLVLISCGPDGKEPAGNDIPSDNNPEGQQPVYETSFEAVANMGVGWNLGNTLEPVWTGDTDGRDWMSWETGWGQAVTTQELIYMMRDAGFGAIRVPVSWGVHMDADGKVYDEWMNRVNQVVDYVINAGLYCIINVHHDTGADEETAWLVADPLVYEKEKARYEGLWKQIAERFRDYDHHLLFESFNEMLDASRSWCFASMNLGYDATAAAGAYKAINDYAQSFVDVVRATGGNNSVRNLVVNTYGACNGAGSWNPHLQDPLKYMQMPMDQAEEHIIFQVHSYPEIDNPTSMKAEVSRMMSDLERYLVSLGGPVIVGEWGTFTENPSLESYCNYAGYFVSEARKRGIGTFHWMGLSDGVYRSVPCFNEPEKVEAIVKGYHGDAFRPVIPVMGDYEYVYKVTYKSQWSEVNLSPSSLNLDEYKGVTFELDKAPAGDELMVKVYGDSDGKEQYVGFDKASATIGFNPDILGSKAGRVTLQYMKTGQYSVTIKRLALVKRDGSEEEVAPSVFWGCNVDMLINK